ncbi:MAG: hypothetical protein ACLSCO_17665 [Gallintestinimicrobium sp.]
MQPVTDADAAECTDTLDGGNLGILSSTWLIFLVRERITCPLQHDGDMNRRHQFHIQRSTPVRTDPAQNI